MLGNRWNPVFVSVHARMSLHGKIRRKKRNELSAAYGTRDSILLVIYIGLHFRIAL